MRFWFIVFALCGTALVAPAELGSPSGQVQSVSSHIQVGWCAPIAQLELAKQVGFDYVELNTSEVASLSDADFEELLTKVKQIGIPTPTANVFIPRDKSVGVVLVGPDVDQAKQMEYVKKALARLSRLGVKILVFGGGKNVPEGFSEDTAFKQLVDFDRRVAAEARPLGITIVIEPTSEGNFIKTIAEGLRLVNATADPNVELMADFYHMAQAKEDPDIILKAGNHIRHIHMANPEGRVFPLKWDEYDYTRFFANLRQIGYQGRISVEASSKDVSAELPQSIALIRHAFQ